MQETSWSSCRLAASRSAFPISPRFLLAGLLSHALLAGTTCNPTRAKFSIVLEVSTGVKICLTLSVPIGQGIHAYYSAEFSSVPLFLLFIFFLNTHFSFFFGEGGEGVGLNMYPGLPSCPSPSAAPLEAFFPNAG